MVTAAAGSLFVVVFLRLGGSLSAGAPAAAPLPPQRNAGLGGGAATTTNINTTDASKPGDLTLLRVDVRGAIKEEVSGSGSRYCACILSSTSRVLFGPICHLFDLPTPLNRLNYVPSKVRCCKHIQSTGFISICI